MPSIAKPIATHPTPQRNALGLTIRDYEGSMSTLCAGCGHDSITAAHHPRPVGTVDAADMVAKLSGIGCSSKTPDLFRRRSTRLQHRPRPHARHRRRSHRSPPRPHLHRHLRRRRLALHRPRPALPRHPPQPAHGLRHRKQRRLRPDQGPIFRLLRHRLQEQARRSQPHGPHRSAFAWPSASEPPS